MQIKITNYGESTNVSVIHPGTGVVSTNLGLAAGDSITLTATNEHEASGIMVGEIESIAVADTAVPSEQESA